MGADKRTLSREFVPGASEQASGTPSLPEHIVTGSGPYQR